MSASNSHGATTFKPISYMVEWKTDGNPSGSKRVDGFAFETPGWPEFHACVRYGNRGDSHLFGDWIIDHYESGLGISGCGRLTCKEDAPEVLARMLNKFGAKRVRKALRRNGC